MYFIKFILYFVRIKYKIIIYENKGEKKDGCYKFWN